ncbi:MAG TPA: hypothetical protein VMT03_22250 [Polyangia bacterium]|nr:hypothetical protein [Polyangia bacterium]
MARRFPAIAAAALLAGALSCATSPPPPAQASSPVDAAEPVPPRSSRRGVVMPSDTALGAGPTGATSNTGTAGPAVGPTIGSGAPN